MQHDIHVTGHAYTLRPVGDADAPLIVQLRSDQTLNRFLHASSSRLQDQLDWLNSYYQRRGDFYFAVENIKSGSTEGVVSVYDIDEQNRCGEWGRWILRPGSLAAIESAWLIYRVAFETLQLDEVCCRTVRANVRVVSFHDSCGIADRRILPAHFDVGGERHDAVEHRVNRQTWPDLDQRLSRLAQMTARRLSRG